jgi:hypothetical protein
MTYYSGIHISARPGNFTLRKCLELTPASRKRMEEGIPAVVCIIFKISLYVIYQASYSITANIIQNKL